MFSVQWLVTCTGFVTKRVYVLIVTPLKTKLKYFLFFIFHHHNSLLVFLCGTYVLPGALSQVNPFAPFQLFPAWCGSHSVVLWRLFLVYPSSLSPWQFQYSVSFYCTLWFVLCMANLMAFYFLYLLIIRYFFCFLL